MLSIGKFFKAVLLVLLPLCICLAQSTNSKNRVLTSGPYFDKTFPSSFAARFAPDIFSEEMHAPPIFSPDGDEVYWNLMDSNPSEILFMKLVDGVWSEAAAAPFSSVNGSDSPFISSDGNTLVFLSRDINTNWENICKAEKIDGEWGAPTILGNEVNQLRPHWQASVSDNQNLYFGAGEDIYISEYIDGNYLTARQLGREINKVDGLETTPFIAPDESYLIFARVRGSSPYSNLFISINQGDGLWSEAVNMGALNSGSHELYPNVSPDGRFIMFLSGRTGILLPYWVDAQVINNYVTDVDNENAQIPDSFQLYENYPNPFNPTTNIKIDLRDGGIATLKVFNSLGEEVAVIINTFMEAGNYDFTFSGANLPREFISAN